MKHTVSEVELKNGAKGLVINVPNTTVVNLLAGFNSGNLFCDQVKFPELSHVMEHVMLGANKKYPTRIEFESEIEKNGAYSNAFTSDYFNTYEYEAADFEALHITDLLATQISTPKFLASEVDSEIANVREELNGYLSDYGRVAYDQLLKQTLGRPTYEDSLASLGSITPEVTSQYYRQTHTAGNMRFIFAGAMNKADAMIKKFEQNCLELPRGKHLDIPKVKPKHLAKPVVITKDIPQIYYYFYQYCSQMSFKDEFVMAIISVILTGRYKSRILGEARERGLAYHVFSGSSNHIGYAAFNMNFFATPANIEELFKLMARVLRDVRAGKITQLEIDEAKQLLLGRRLRSYKTPSDLINWYYYHYLAHGRIEDFNHANEELKAITHSDVSRVAGHLFKTPKWGLALVGAVDDKLATKLHKTLAGIWQ